MGNKREFNPDTWKTLQFSIRIPKETMAIVEKIADVHKVSRGRVITRIVVDYCSKLKKI